ncbi:hypothetical protein K435DRAFT_964647 [Dendrothele bispora CBS 962.96]|uniref:Uncharacterized protein n=1 Tax=Dendrothele bispora (strain CBS 962.96) TaxID=1314807 RepID=A0A4S8M9A6_DENBC|nr:hypothetical protein K435DRAFT_964647 [Dendrothele bispora CBS 962.96]
MDFSLNLPRSHTVLSSTYSSIDNSTDTATISTGTVHGPGALSGRALKALGTFVIRASDELVLRRRLANLHRQFLRSSPHGEGYTHELLNVPSPKEWADILEFSRRDLYTDDIRRQALEIILTYLIDLRMQRDSFPLMAELLQWPEDEITIFFSELISILPDDRLETISRNSFHSSLRNRFDVPRRRLTAVLLQCMQMLTLTSRKISCAIINAGILDLVLAFSSSKDGHVLVRLLYKMLSLGEDVRECFRLALSHRSPEDIHSVLRIMLCTLKLSYEESKLPSTTFSLETPQDLISVFLHSCMSNIFPAKDTSELAILLSEEDIVFLLLNDAGVDDQLYQHILDSQSMASTRRNLQIDIMKLLCKMAVVDSDSPAYPSRFLFTSLVLRIVVALWVVRDFDKVLLCEDDAAVAIRKTKFPERLFTFLGMLVVIFRMKEDITDFVNGLNALLADLPSLDEEMTPNQSVDSCSLDGPSMDIVPGDLSDLEGYM